MSEMPFKQISCPVLVLRIEQSQLMGDVVAEALRDEFLQAVRLVGARHVIVDFAIVAYLSSASFRPLLSLLRELRAHGGRLVLCNLQPDVLEIFEVTRLIASQNNSPAAFEVQANLAEAIACLSQSAPPRPA
jgi:anti-anti-sigma factor